MENGAQILSHRTNAVHWTPALLRIRVNLNGHVLAGASDRGRWTAGESLVIREFLFLPRVKRQLVDGTLPSSQAFVYFVIITAVDNLQLGLLQVSPAQPTRWTPLAVGGSLAVGGVFLVATYLLNGGSAGRDYLIRYFSISAVVALWVALPLQLLISLPRIVASLANLDWYVPAVLFTANIFLFSFIALQVRDVASRSRLQAA